MEFTLKKSPLPASPKGEEFNTANGRNGRHESSKTTASGRVKFTGGTSVRCVDTLHSRTAFAVKVYPELKNNERQACKQVVSDIYANLHQEMREAGWRKGELGYTDRQLEILNRFYEQPLSPSPFPLKGQGE